MKKAILLTAITISMLGATQTTLAASQDECAIWICLPGGFPSGCGAAHSAMKKRLKNFKPPLPSFSSCLVGSDSVQSSVPGATPSKMTYKMGKAVWMPARSTCDYSDGFYSYGNQNCTTIAAHWDKNFYAQHCGAGGGDGIDNRCYHSKRYIDVYLDGQQTGSTYYW